MNRLPRAKPRLDFDRTATPYNWRNDPMFEGCDEPDEQPVTTPATPPRPAQEPFTGPSEADRSWAAEASARGSFLPAIRVPGMCRPRGLRKNDRWGKALSNWKDAGCPDVPPK
jgi:hypothetical protein